MLIVKKEMCSMLNNNQKEYFKLRNNYVSLI